MPKVISGKLAAMGNQSQSVTRKKQLHGTHRLIARRANIGALVITYAYAISRVLSFSYSIMGPKTPF